MINTERRCSNRLDYAVNIIYKFEDGSKYKVTQSINVSDAGMSIKVNNAVPIAENIRFMIEGYEEIFTAKVVWCKREAEVITSRIFLDKYRLGITYQKNISERVNLILRDIIGEEFNQKVPR